MYSVYSMQKLSILQAAEKKSAYRKHRIENIEKAYMYDKSSMWSVLDKACREISTCNETQDESF